MISDAQSVMGTVVSFLVDSPDLPEDDVRRALGEARAELHRLDERFSTWKSDSELSRRRRGEATSPSNLMREVMELCGEACEMSQGFFDPWAMPGGFDPTGLVKGWAAERALAILANEGIAAALVNAGGDVAVMAGRTYEVGVQHPREPDALCAVVRVDCSAATSGIYARGHHLIHPFGGVVAATSATVVGGRLAIADALATALAVGGTEMLYVLESLESVEGFFITEQGALFKTSSMEFV